MRAEHSKNPGYVHVYTGNGKGKTTAALGLALRAAGAGMKVYIGQFVKCSKYSEICALDRFTDYITYEQFGTGGFISGTPSPADLEAARSGLARVKKVIASKEYHVVILDEINITVSLGLLKTPELVDIIKTRPYGVELILTGRNAAPEIISAADLVTEMREIKHYYSQGVTARPGIEK